LTTASSKSSTPKAISSKKSPNLNLISILIKKSSPLLRWKIWKTKKCHLKKKKASPMSLSTLTNDSAKNCENKPLFKRNSIPTGPNFRNKAGFMKSSIAKAKIPKQNFRKLSLKADMPS
jgi:hypothetical protein